MRIIFILEVYCKVIGKQNFHLKTKKKKITRQEQCPIDNGLLT